MKLTLEYLLQRHDYWRIRIGDMGIWDPDSFEPVTIMVRKASRSYHALFQRKIRIKGGKKEITDRIIIYNKVEDFDTRFLDSILVHEMIHQYIIQNKLKDLRSHGPLFRGYMQRINLCFPEELQIKIRDRNPSVAEKGPGEILHQLLILEYETGGYFCAIIYPGKMEYFENLVCRNKKRWGIKRYFCAESSDIFFQRYRRCMKSLHGMKKTEAEMQKFCRDYNVRISN